MVDETMFTDETAAMLTPLYRISLSILRADADAQDAVQQGLLKAWAARGRANPATFRAWVTRIVVNECRNIQRHRMRVAPVEDISRAQPFDLPDLDVRDAITALPEKWRTPFLLMYAARFSEKEIAVILKIPKTMVKSRMHSARRALRERLSDREVVFE